MKNEGVLLLSIYCMTKHSRYFIWWYSRCGLGVERQTEAGSLFCNRNKKPITTMHYITCMWRCRYMGRCMSVTFSINNEHECVSLLCLYLGLHLHSTLVFSNRLCDSDLYYQCDQQSHFLVTFFQLWSGSQTITRHKSCSICDLHYNAHISKDIQ